MFLWKRICERLTKFAFARQDLLKWSERFGRILELWNLGAHGKCKRRVSAVRLASARWMFSLDSGSEGETGKIDVQDSPKFQASRAWLCIDADLRSIFHHSKMT